MNTFLYEVESKSVFPLFSCSMILFLLISFSLSYGSNQWPQNGSKGVKVTVRSVDWAGLMFWVFFRNAFVKHTEAIPSFSDKRDCWEVAGFD